MSKPAHSERPEPKRTRGLAPLLPLDEALARVRARVSPHGRVERVSLGDALGRVLAEDVVADQDQPAFNRSMMDGIAVRGAECTDVGAVVTGAGAAPAGHPHAAPVAPGTFVRVMTGGVVPPGADSVVPVERITRIDGPDDDPAAGTWRIDEAVRPGQHVALIGCEVTRGEVVIQAGSTLTPARIGVLAAFGYSTVQVAARPRVAVLPTGSEIVPVTATPELGQVRNSNAWALSALFRSFGAAVSAVGGPVVDERDALDAALLAATADHDLIVTCGGVSMGDYDLVVGSLGRLGAEIVFHRVRLKPGKPVLLAVLQGTVILGLPGNPVSATVCGTLFGRVALAALTGARRQRWLQTTAPAAADVRRVGPREEMRVGVWRDQGPDTASALLPVRLAGSADLAHFAAGDTLLRRAPGAPAASAGEPLDVWSWPES